MYLMIDPASPDHDAAQAESRFARNHALDSFDARDAGRFYAGPDHGINHMRAAALVEANLASQTASLIAESHALRRLNTILLHSGGSVGSEYLIGRSVYRVSNAGQMAAYLGEQIPTDELHLHYEGLDNAADEMVERRSSYEDAIRVTH